MTPDNIIDVSEADFEYEVIEYSHNTPVVVDFWAAWCQPCKTLLPVLEKLAKESAGAIRLARVNVDANPNLAIRFGVRSIPMVKAFSGGAVVGEFTGTQPETRVREFFSRIQPPSPAALALEHALSLLTNEQWSEAEPLLRKVLDPMPNHPAALLGLARALLAQGKAHESRSILSAFPASREFSHSQALLPLADAIEKLLHHPAGAEEDERQAAYWNAIRLAARGRAPLALDGLLDLLREDRRNPAARQIILSLLELLGDDNPQTRIYRNELASILF
ncbi:MAG: tetratricopeptide repeat protein [Chloroflexota bacterium]|jgi:putative thioredoxin